MGQTRCQLAKIEGKKRMKKINALIVSLVLVFSLTSFVSAKTTVGSESMVLVIKTTELATKQKTIEKKLERAFREADGQIRVLSSAEREKVVAVLLDGDVDVFDRKQMAAGGENGKTNLLKLNSVKNPDGTETPIGAGYKMEFQIFGVGETPKEGLIVELAGEFGNEGTHNFADWKTKSVNRQIENGGAIAFTENGMFVLIAAIRPQ